MRKTLEFIRRYTYSETSGSIKTKTFQVMNNRVLFRCANCGSKRNVSVPPNLNRKSIRCHKCKKTTKCILNRRATPRVAQCGKIYLTTVDGEELEVTLVDVSDKGIGLEIPFEAVRARKLNLDDRISFRCTWNRRLLSNGLYVVKNIRERHVGVEKVR